jgi:hypothetical protein
LKDSLYDRADVLHTSYISYEEYHSLYPDRGIYEYINNGGILSNPTVHKNMHEQEYLSYLKKSYDYIETSIVDNLFNSLDKYEFFDTRYPNLSEMHLLDEKKLKVLVFKWIQRCTQPLAIRVLERTLKSSDIGNLENVARKRGYVGDVSGFSDALYQRLMTRLTQNNYTNYTQDFQEELLKYFSDIGCVVTCNSMDYSIFVPVAVRMGCIFELMNIVVDCYDDISNQYGCVVDLETVQITMLNNIYEVLIESIVLTDLVCKGVPVGREIMCDAVKEKSQ